MKLLLSTLLDRLRRSHGTDGLLLRLPEAPTRALAILATANKLVPIVLPPEGLKVPLGQASHPGQQNTTRDLIGPRLLLILIRGDNSTTTNLFQHPDSSIQHNIHTHTGNKAVGNRVGKGHQGNSNKDRNAVARIAPVNLRNILRYHQADKDQYAAYSPQRDRGKDKYKEDRDKEVDTRHHCRQASLAALSDSST